MKTLQQGTTHHLTEDEIINRRRRFVLLPITTFLLLAIPIVAGFVPYWTGDWSLRTGIIVCLSIFGFELVTAGAIIVGLCSHDGY